MSGSDRFFNKTNKYSAGLVRLTTQDTGQYSCYVNMNGSASTPINLEVKKDACCGNDVQLEKSEGEDFNISCPYLDIHTQSPKFFCQVRCREYECYYSNAVKTDRTWEHIKNHVLYDDREARVLIVTYKKFTEFNSGSYWCGADVQWHTDGYKVLFHHIALRKRERQTSKPTTTPQSTPLPPPPPSTSSSVLVKDLKKKCKEYDVECKLDFLNKLVQNSSVSTLQPKEVSSLLDVLLEDRPESLALRGEDVLQASEKLAAMLVEPTNTQGSRNLSTNTTEVRVLSIGQKNNLTRVPQLKTTDIRLDIDLLGIAQKNNGSASVVLVVYNSMREVLNGSFFKTGSSETANMMSNVISVILPNTTNKALQTPVNLTIKHLKHTSPKEKPVCVYWNVSAWIVDGCHVSEPNTTHTVCSCEHLSTFALIMTINHNLEEHPVVEVLNTIFVLIGLVFLTMAVMTFALCRWNPRVSNVARLNLCVCLLLAHPLFLLTQSFLRLIKPHKMLCNVLSGVLHFLLLCCFAWMSIEAVLLFLSVRKLKQVKPNERAIHWKVKFLIGYGIPLIIVAVSAGVKPDGYGNDKCWLSQDKGFIWSFLGPACFFLAGNILLFLIISITIYSTLKAAHSDVSKVNYNRVLLFKIMVQFIILGCPWILGLLAAHSRVLEVLFLFLTSQQGTAIFLIHCLFNIEVRRQYRTWWQRYGPFTKPRGSSEEQSISMSQQISGATLSSNGRQGP